MSQKRKRTTDNNLLDNNNKKKQKKKEELCVICYDSITEKQKTANPSQIRACHPTRGGVSHVFHTECINHWLSGTDVYGNPRNSCPSCGAQIPCLTNQEYDNEFREGDAQYMDQLIPDNNNDVVGPILTEEEEAAFIDSIMWDVDEGNDGRALAMNEPTGPGSIVDTEEWNNSHPNGPQWTATSCDYCDNFQWFLSNEPEGSNQPAFDLADWYSWESNMICPDCKEGSSVCEACGEWFITEMDQDEYLYRDPYTGDGFCEDCLRNRYRDDDDIKNLEGGLDEFINNVYDGAYSGNNPKPLPGSNTDNNNNNQAGRRRKKKKKQTKKQKKRCRKKKRKKKNKLTKRKLLTKILKRLRRRGGRKTRRNKNTKKRRRTRRRR